MISPFEYSNYKEFLKKVIEQGSRGIVGKLAEAGGCQRSYLSQAINSHVNLTADQVCGIAAFLHLSNLELEYLLLLLESERASSPVYRAHIQNKIESIMKKSRRLSKQVRPKQDKKVAEKYYSAWYYSAIHIATSIEDLKTEADFARYLNLPEQLVSETLRQLEKWGLVCLENSSWNYAGQTSIHLSDDSNLNRMNHLNWRGKALNQGLQPEQDLHYTSVFALSKKDFEKLRSQIMKLVQDQRECIQDSGSEELVSFCCDFFRVV